MWTLALVVRAIVILTLKNSHRRISRFHNRKRSLLKRKNQRRKLRRLHLQLQLRFQSQSQFQSGRKPQKWKLKWSKPLRQLHNQRKAKLLRRKRLLKIWRRLKDLSHCLSWSWHRRISERMTTKSWKCQTVIAMRSICSSMPLTLSPNDLLTSSTIFRDRRTSLLCKWEAPRKDGMEEKSTIWTAMVLRTISYSTMTNLTNSTFLSSSVLPRTSTIRITATCPATFNSGTTWEKVTPDGTDKTLSRAAGPPPEDDKTYEQVWTNSKQFEHFIEL